MGKYDCKDGYCGAGDCRKCGGQSPEDFCSIHGELMNDDVCEYCREEEFEELQQANADLKGLLIGEEKLNSVLKSENLLLMKKVSDLAKENALEFERGKLEGFKEAKTIFMENK